MRKKTRFVAVGGIVVALTFILCWLGSVSSSLKFLAPMICGILLMVVFRHFSGKVAVMIFVASSLLLLLLPNRISAYAYLLLLGYYPLLCEVLKKQPVLLRILIKLVLFTAVGFVILLSGAAMLGLWENEKFLQYYPLTIVAYYAIAVVYDMVLFLLRWRFESRWDEKLRKLLS